MGESAFGRFVSIGFLFPPLMAAPVMADGVADTSKLDEIVVTADKRAENILDVPNSMVAIGGERLESLNLGSLSDLADYVPGLTIASGGYPGSRNIAIRGLSDSGGLAGPFVVPTTDFDRRAN
jgi:iron complex outermembrane receptor protein